ncbi:MAG TPA: DmsC/YnfH family molybdoenzyme membrane anchor subunit [Acidimicrobiales bacterium]|nr:DmsC/YnfH family molybdoenzyme membrane anchor subunit [Acidimicrobiales bacterium]
MTLLSSIAAPEATPVDRWLAEQADLTAVERFAQRHEADGEHAQARYYRDLLPTAAPGAGQQYAFRVDLDACTGCKACVVACHSLNGLDEDEAWRRVTRVDGERNGVATQQTVTAACHHCADPACMRGCPVNAYEKDPVTGIVRHLDDQCIGCSYCTLTCPYEVPTFNHRLGIVRKCDMCSGRLAEGEAPACVQGCPNQAISITIVDTADIADRLSTTQYVTAKPTLCIPALAGVHSDTQSRKEGHPALAVMLVLTQLSVGAFVTELLLGRRSVVDSSLIAAVGLLALGASVFHLGRPQYAYRALLGLRTSWLSREILAFGVFMPLAIAYAVKPLPALGVAGVLCSVLIYATTPRWGFAHVCARFFGGAAIAGLATVALIVSPWSLPLFAAVITLQLRERLRFFTR